jgi:TolB-like protein/DNA-binding winged helix-turn-helix (wHTH) protein/Tfp pilus assembly protein PilF
MPSRDRTGPAEVFRLGEWRVDVAPGTLTRGDEQHRIEPKVMAVLVLLAGRAGHVLSKEEILAAVWPDAVVEEVALARSVSELRRVLGDEAHQPRYIETLPKRGYRVIAPVGVIEPEEGLALPRSRRRSRWPIAAVALGVALAAIALWVVGSRTGSLQPGASGDRTKARERPTLAVLPFSNLGPPEELFFADGLTDEITSRLAENPRLAVISHTSAAHYAAGDRPLPKIGEALGADYVLEGSVRWERAGGGPGRVRVSPQLIRVADDTHVWSQTYERELQGVFALQSAVAGDVAQALGARIAADEIASLPPIPTRSLEAYEAYLEGVQRLGRYTDVSVRAGLKRFERAVALDPRFALAHARRGQALWFLAQPLGGLPQGEALPEALRAAERALQLDEGLPEAHVTLGWVRLWYRWDWVGAEASFRRALALRPSEASAHIGLGFALTVQRRHEEAITEGARGVRLSPLGLSFRTAYTEILWYARRDQEAEEQARRAARLDPAFPRPFLVLAWILEARGSIPDAAEAYATFLRKGGAREEVAAAAVSAARAGPEAYWRWRLGAVAGAERAWAWARLGERDAALATLERAYGEHVGGLVLLAVAPWYDPLRSDPRFEALVARMGFPPPPDR